MSLPKSKPLNGEKTHTLSAHAIAELRNIAKKPLTKHEVNPGVIDRLLREDLIELVSLPSPFKTHKGGTCLHCRITEAGQKVIARSSETA